MPLLETLKSDDPKWEDEDVKQAIRAAVARMVDRGWQHNDVRRRHVGLCTVNGVLETALLDLSDMKQIEPGMKKTVQLDTLEKLQIRIV